MKLNYFQGALYPWRFCVIVGLLLAMVGAIVWRIVDLHVIDHDSSRARATRVACGISPSLRTGA